MNLALNKNINNLNTFWQAFGVNINHEFLINPHWPHKQWCSDFSLPKPFSNALIAADKNFYTMDDVSTIDPSAFTLKSQLVVMNLALTEHSSAAAELASSNNIIEFTDEADAHVWSRACSLAFGYQVDPAVMKKLFHDPNARIYGYLINQEIAGTVVSYQTGDTLGVHQLGTVPAFQRQGVAGKLMAHILTSAHQTQCRWVSLQASQAGLKLYQRLGFKALATLTCLSSE